MLSNMAQDGVNSLARDDGGSADAHKTVVWNSGSWNADVWTHPLEVSRSLGDCK